MLKMVEIRWFIILIQIVTCSLAFSIEPKADAELEPDCRSFGNADRFEVAQHIARWNAVSDKVSRQSAIASWNWATNITDENSQKSTEIDIKAAAVYKRNWKEARCIESCEFCSPDLRRQLLLYQMGVDTSALPEEHLSKFEPIMREMRSIYSKAKVCNITGYSSSQCLPLDPNLSDLLQKQGNYCFLAEIWKGWRDATGKKMRNLYRQYLEYLNEAALLNGYENAQQMWLSDFTMDRPDFLNEVLGLWDELKPFYQQLHAFVRSKLIRLYGRDKFPPSGHIPAHLFGNMWAQAWDSLINLALPNPDTKFINLTHNLIRNNATVDSIFRTADEFFQSLGLEPMTDVFWEKSVFTKIPGVDMVCHASAWDLQAKDDFRIKMCTVVDGSDFETVYHELGHIAYYQSYASHPVAFRGGANPGFHEAIGDLIALSAVNPRHLKALGLVSDDELNDENEDAVFLNALMQRALRKIAFLPFAMLVDVYRYGLFNGTTPTDRLNAEWWKLRCSVQGISPPVPRSENDFDAGSKFHIPSSSQYLNYFVAAFLQFDFHENVCRRIGFTENFHKCDIWRNPEAAKVFKEMLALGRSKPHPEALRLITGGRDRMSAGPMLRYFKPLYDWLVKQNAKLNEPIGWDESHCPLPVYNCDL